MTLKFMGHDHNTKVTNEGINNQVHVSNEVHINDDNLLIAIWSLFGLVILIIIFKIYTYMKGSWQRSVLRRVALNNVTTSTT